MTNECQITGAKLPVLDGGPAFPVADQGAHGCYGMSLRDYFAAKAMLGEIAYFGGIPPTPEARHETARLACDMADALIKALKAEVKP